MANRSNHVNVKLNIETFNIKMLEERILKGALNMVAPDADTEGTGVVLIVETPILEAVRRPSASLGDR